MLKGFSENSKAVAIMRENLKDETLKKFVSQLKFIKRLKTISTSYNQTIATIFVGI